MNRLTTKLFTAVSLATLTAYSGSGYAQQSNESAETIEELVILGSRSAKARSAADSPVPVDVISGEDFSSLGNSADITDNLKAVIPSYTATPATGDGSAFVRPTSLRGMSPDQTLVLVNGKRRHRSALVQFFAPAAGNGSHGVDVAMIPSMAIKNVQVLRDGAAAQYGSDAIAGVINFELRDDTDGAEIQVQYGEFYEGESSTKIGANLGFEAGENGFINATLEYADNDALSRGVIRPDAQALLDAGVQGVGADTPFGDAPFTQTWGRPETSATRFFVNAGWELDNGSELYMFGNYADTEGRYRFFYRNPSHPTLVGDNGVCNLNPALQICNVGFTPFLDGDQTDQSIVVGLRGDFSDRTSYDFSINYGENELDYFLNNTINTGLGLQADGTPLMDFDVGGYESDQIVLSADFSTVLNDNLVVSYGAEWREEGFTLNTGDANSAVSPGPSGFAPPTAESAGTFDRDNYAVYVDVEHDITDKWLMQYALRFEDYSDFGNTTNGKIATRYNVNDNFTLRGAVSTGFKAPTPGQSNISSIITTFDGRTGLQVEEGLVPANSAAARNAGGTDLQEEESTNISLGFSTTLGENWELTVDYYNVEVDDRIYRTGDIPIPGTEDNTLSFYTNALDVEHEGFDIVLTGGINWGRAETDVTFAYAHNEIDVVGQTPVAGILPVSAATIEDIENNYPEDRFTLTTNTFLTDSVNLLIRATYYGDHFDERGTINGAPGSRSAEIDAVTYFDAEIGWQYNDNMRFVLGASNIFDEFVDEIPDNGVFANRQSVGLQYPRRTAANYEGGSWYLKGIFNF